MLDGTCTGCLGKRDNKAKDEPVLLCDGRGCCREYHLGCTDPLLTEVPDGEFFCVDCDPVGSTRLLELYFDECADKRSTYVSSKDYVERLVDEHMQMESGGDPAGVEIVAEDPSSGGGGSMKKRKHDTMDSLASLGALPASEISRIAELHRAVMDDSRWGEEKTSNEASQIRPQQVGQEILVGKIVKVYCTTDYEYHTGRIIDWRSAVAPGVDPKIARRQFHGTGGIASTEFLVRFASGMDGRKKTLLQWIVLEEHSCAVSSIVVMALRDKGRGMNGWRPAQIMLRSCLELVPIRNLISKTDHCGLVTFFGADASIYLDLDTDAVDISSQLFHTELRKKLASSPLKKAKNFSTQARLMGLAMAATSIELQEQRRAFKWSTLPLHNRFHDKALSVVDEYSSELLLDTNVSTEGEEKTKDELPEPLLCPLVQRGLDRQWIASRLARISNDKSLDSMASMKASVYKPACVAMALLNDSHRASI